MITKISENNQEFQPFATTEPSLIKTEHPVKPSNIFGQFQSKFPLPTNRWWQSIVLEDNQGKIGEQRIASLPYTLKALPSSLVVNLPALQFIPRDLGAKPGPVGGTVFSPDLESMRFSATAEFISHALTEFDDLSVQLQYQAADGTMKLPIVRGMPYITAEYDNLIPKITSNDGFLSVNGSINQGTVGPGTKFVVEKNNGETWVIYTSTPVTCNWVGAPAELTVMDSSFTGTVRMALVKSNSVNNDITILDAYKDVIPTGGTVGVSLNGDGDTATVTFNWQTSGSGELLIMAMPHHLDVLVGANVQPGVKYPMSRGEMLAVSGNTWMLKYPVPDISFSAPRTIDPKQEAAIRTALSKDVETVTGQIDDPGVANPYEFGKRIAAMGRLAVIADELGDIETARQAREAMKGPQGDWLQGKLHNGNRFLYDTTWGGIVSSQGIKDQRQDFQQGYYNDHHFHYGYYIYASAAIAKQDKAWLAANQDAVIALIRDIANPSKADPYFTPFRHTDWFLGHSWANGLFALGDSRNQESVSEAVNAWYAVALFGQVIGNEEMQAVGRLLAAMEIVAARKYWQIPNRSTIYPSELAQIGAAPNVWSTKVDFATYFGFNDEYFFGIISLPFTPISEALVNPQWISDRWESRLQPRLSGNIDENWRAYVYMLQSTFDIAGAQANMANSPPKQYLPGNTETNTRWFLSTRP